MKEFNIDLIIDKTFNVRAETLEDAKALAIQKACKMMSSYNSITIDNIEEIYEDEDLEFENEYEVMCFDTSGCLINTYFIEADYSFGAAQTAEEFFKDDFPNYELSFIRVLIGDDYTEFLVPPSYRGIINDNKIL